MPIVGTAGHVDHGKSSLVKALTGSDPDRLAEEKERGLTIDLGFAWATIGDHDVGFIDVPGHEKFVKNMLAGVGALDCALLVVAADSGWMPQTEEHVAVLDLLEVDRGVIALSRTDLVDGDTIELAQLEILEEVSGTSLEGWPIVAVSSVSGAGIDTLTAAIRAVLDDGGTPAPDTFRMWVTESSLSTGRVSWPPEPSSAGPLRSATMWRSNQATEPRRCEVFSTTAARSSGPARDRERQ